MMVEGNTTAKLHHIRQQNPLRYSDDPITEFLLPTSA